MHRLPITKRIMTCMMDGFTDLIQVAVMLGFFLVIMSVLSKSLLFSSPMFASFFQSFETLFFLLVPLNVIQVITAVLQTNNAGWGILFTAVSWIFGGKVQLMMFCQHKK